MSTTPATRRNRSTEFGSDIDEANDAGAPTGKAIVVFVSTIGADELPAVVKTTLFKKLALTVAAAAIKQMAVSCVLGLSSVQPLVCAQTK